MRKCCVLLICLVFITGGLFYILPSSLRPTFLKSETPHQNDDKIDLQQFLRPIEKPLIKIGEKEYPKDLIVYDFIQAAFSDALWRPLYNSSEQYAIIPYHNSRATLPRHNAINKWSLNNSIPLRINGRIARGAYETTTETYDVYQSRLRPYIKDLKNATGIALSLYSPEDAWEREKTRQNKAHPAHFLNINFSKNYIPDHHMSQHPRVEAYYTGAVRFLNPQKDRNIGFLLPNNKNEIQFTQCFIGTRGKTYTTKRNPEDVEIDIKNCLLSSLGLPNIRAIKTRDMSLGDNSFSPYEVFMLKLLYCDALKAGDDKNKVIWTLMNSDQCF